MTHSWLRLAAAVILIVATGSAATAQPAMKFVDQPVVSAVNRSPPAADVPKEIASWFGRWIGKWDGEWPVVIAVKGFEYRDDAWLAKVNYFGKRNRLNPTEQGWDWTKLSR